MKRVPRVLSFLFLIYLTGVTVPFLAASPSKLVEEGNRLYRKGKYNEANQSYEKAAVDIPESPEIYFNKGNAYLAQGDMEKARELFRQAAQKATEVKLEARAKYNLGNLTFQEAVKYQDDDLQKALSKLEESALFYREVLDMDPSDEDSKYNIEVARLFMKDILDKLKKQQEEQKAQQEKAKDLAEKLKRLIADQGEELEKTKELATRKVETNQPPSEEIEAEDKELKALIERQGKTREETGELTKELQDLSRQAPPQADNPFTKMAEHTDKANLAQAVAENELRKGELARAKDDEEEALEELKKALDLLKKPGSSPPPSGENEQKEEEEKGEQKESQPAQQDEEKKEGSREEQAGATDTEARDILEEEQKNRAQRNLPRDGGYRPVDKDW